MQKIVRPLRPTLFAATLLISAGLAGHALAECEEAEEATAGKAVATAAAAKVATAVAVTGKQMIDVTECSLNGGGVLVIFKYNVLGADGLYWIQGSAKVKGAAVIDMKVLQMSPNLSAASAAKGVKLASN
ncbi:hypothetical protein [Asticcacaulis sp. AC402]|uniref:hypothetical protein n=1 Tax=Asticcacaulis sp. AC402 TaxID=1282361 RepID=UPI0003C3B773|nr:hypothetical protein [Asticcacaulis sp. AC402]ESQ74354.1 hypothetical protein ABAC402_14575 [Asticcacaulis sp. AC402]